MRVKHNLAIALLISIFIIIGLVISITMGSNIAYAGTDNVLETEGTELNGAELLNDDTKYIPVKSYIPKHDNGYKTSDGYSGYALLKDGKETPYVSFYVDTLGEGGYVYKGAEPYYNYNAYGFVAGEGEDVPGKDDEGNEITLGKRSVAIKLKYNFGTTTDILGVDNKLWSISDDSWKSSVNGIESVGVIGKGAVIVQKFVPTGSKQFPSTNSDWYRMNEFSESETAGIHTVNFFSEYAPENNDEITVYTPSGGGLAKRHFYQVDSCV